MTIEPSDNALMVRVAAGDTEAFRTLVERHQQRVLTVATRFLGDQARGEEIAQEAFLRIFRSAQRYRADANFVAWLFTIVKRCCFNALRTNQREASRLTASSPPAAAVNPEQRLLRREQQQQIQVALLKLPARQRLVVVLHCFEGLAQAEIATILGTTVRGVESSLFRARRRLAELLDTDRGVLE